MAALVAAIHTRRLAWVFMGRRHKAGDDGGRNAEGLIQFTAKRL
jgi:hypothetical protein